MTRLIRYIYKHLKLLLILIGASGASYTSYGQGGFSRLYLEGSGTANILYDHPHIITAAQTSDTNFTRGILFMKLNTNGDTLLTRTFFNNSRNTHPGLQNSLIKTGLNEYILVGRQSPQAYIMRLDTNFNILDTTFFQFSGERTSAISVTQAANTDLLVTGTVYWLDTIRQERRKGFLAARFDAQLNLKWIKRFHTPSVNGKTVEQQAYHIKEDWFGDILLSGYRQAISGDNSADGLILKIDSTGQLLWQQLIGGSSFDDDIINIELTPDSTYFISTSFGVELLDLGASDIRSKKVNRFLVLDTNGLVVWDKLYHVPLPSNFVSDLVKVNNGMVTMGSYIDWDTDWQTRDALFRSYTFKTDFKGDSIWYREYVAGTFQSDWNILYDLAATSDGGLVAGGHFLSHNNSPLTGQGGSHVWIVRTDSMGCVVQGCQYISTEEPIELAGITVYPNPAQSHITLSLLPTSEPVDLSIYNTQGQIVKQCMNTHANDQVLINDLIKGLYLVQFSREGQTLGEERLLIE